jgi:hypothetical protein
LNPFKDLILEKQTEIELIVPDNYVVEGINAFIVLT